MKPHFFQNLKDKTILLGGDHHSRLVVEVIHDYLLKRGLKSELVQYDDQNKDYITQSQLVAGRVSESPHLYCGIVGCKNGFGVTLVCNKYQNIFATRCDTKEQAIDARRVNYSNILTFGASFVSEEEIKEIVNNWLETEFDLDEKNTLRLQRLWDIENHI